MDGVFLNKDPMMEIFFEECSDLLTQYETYLSMAAERNEYTMDIVNEIFRITHTIKADATMMLFESLAHPMRAFERLLYFYRDEKADIDFDRFTELLSNLVEYCVEEMDRLMEGKAEESDGNDIVAEFTEYRDMIAGELKVETVESVEATVKSESRDEPMRFYIGSAVSSENDEKHGRFESIRNDTKTAHNIVKEERAAIKAANERKKKKEAEKDRDDAATEEPHFRTRLEGRGNCNEELRELYGIVKKITVLETEMKDAGRDDPGVSAFAEKLHEYDIDLMNWLTNAATVPMAHISPKLFKTVEEMNQRLGRNIKLTIEGEHVSVDKEWIDGISGALVHLLRNAVDHGIETKELRTSLGKPPEGNISIRYYANNKDFIMTISDDGRGINIEKLKESAIDRGLIFEGDELSKEDIIKLIFVPGISTNDKEGIYSGRGVGMDAVLHNIEVLGGRIETDTEEGNGTKFTIYIPLNAVTGRNDGEEQEGNEDIDSRR